MLPRVAVLCASALWGAAAQWAKCCICKQNVVCERKKATFAYFGVTGTCDEGAGQRDITVQGEDCSGFNIRRGNNYTIDLPEKIFRERVITTLYGALHEAAKTRESRKDSKYFTEYKKDTAEEDKEYKGLTTQVYTELVRDVTEDTYGKEVTDSFRTIDKPTCVYIPGDFSGLKIEKVESNPGKWRVGIDVPDAEDISDMGVEEGADHIVTSYIEYLAFKGASWKKLEMVRAQADRYNVYTEDYVKKWNWTLFMKNYDEGVPYEYKNRGRNQCYILAAGTSGGVKTCTSCSEMPTPEVQKRRVRGRSVRRLRTLLARILKRG